MDANGTAGALAALEPPPVRDPLYIVVPITVAYSAIFVSGVTGNLVTCVVISRNKHMHTATNYYLFSLACSDLLLLVSGLPQEMYSIWSRYPYVFGHVFCVLRGLAAETSANATVLTITAFTVERYVAICHPFYAHSLSKLSRAVRLILVIWAVSLAFAIPQAWQFGVTSSDLPQYVQCLPIAFLPHAFELSTLLFFVLPMTVITVLYALIGLRLRRSALLKKSSGSFSHHQESRTPCRTSSSRRVLKMLVAVVVAFFICWAPFHAQRLVAIYTIPSDGDHPASPLIHRIYEVVTYLSGILYYMSTTVNPILYHIMSLKFREAFKESMLSDAGIHEANIFDAYYIFDAVSSEGSACAKQAAELYFFVDSLCRCWCWHRAPGRPYNTFSIRQQRSLALLHSKSVTDSAPSQSDSRDRSDNTVKRQASETTCTTELTESRPGFEKCGRTSGGVSCMSCLQQPAASPPCQPTHRYIANNISNSSLKDVDRDELQKELTQYMLEVARRRQ